MRFATVTTAIRGINWRTRYKRGFDAGALTLFLGPPLGGLAFGIIADVNFIILASRGQLTIVETLWLSFLCPIGCALAAFILPGAWLAVATGALYVAARVGVTGRMIWTESILLAVICSVLSLLDTRPLRAALHLFFSRPGFARQ
jgi:hypothetical protein